MLTEYPTSGGGEGGTSPGKLLCPVSEIEEM